MEDKELMKKDCIRRKKHLEQGRLAAFPVKKSVNYLRTITSMRMTRKCEETALNGTKDQLWAFFMASLVGILVP